MSHSKAPSVLVDGQVVRWCQQCCCFHELSAFDDDKRCCSWFPPCAIMNPLSTPGASGLATSYEGA